MAKKQAPDRSEQGRSTADYYKLNRQAIDDLINADKSNSPEVSDKEIKKYGGKKRRSISTRLKALFVKAWFNGVVCYFFLWGLGSYVRDSLDLWVICGIALGFVTDIITNNILRLFVKDDAESAKYMMYAQKKRFITLPLNVLHALALMGLTVMTYGLISRVVNVGVEPILFGLVVLGWDMLLIRFKAVFKTIIAQARAKVDAEMNRKS